MTLQELLEATITTLKTDAQLASIMAVGTGTDKVRYSRNLGFDADPILAVDPSPSTSGGVPGSSITVFSFDSWAKAEASTIPDPMQLVAKMSQRVRDIFTGRRACNVPHGILDSHDLPELGTLDQGEFWRSSVRVRFPQ